MNYTIEVGGKTHKFTDDAITFKNTQNSFADVPGMGNSSFSFRLDEQDYTPEREKMLKDAYNFLLENKGAKDSEVTIKYYSSSAKKYIVVGCVKNRVIENETKLEANNEGKNRLLYILSIMG